MFERVRVFEKIYSCYFSIYYPFIWVVFFVSPVRNVEKLDQTASLSSLAQEKSARATSLELNGGSLF